MPSPVYLAGAALTPFGRAEAPLVDILVQAAAGALASAGLSEVDSVFLGVMNPEEFIGEGNLAAALADRLDLGGAASSRVETASSTGAGALESAFFAVASGYRRHVLVVAGEKMTGLSLDATTRILAEVIAPSERRYGASMPALAALVAQAYAHRWGLGDGKLSDVLCQVAMKNHARGALNPMAQFRRPISEDDYRSSRPVAEPLRLYDCAPITDGACAVVLSSHKGEVRIAGMGHATDSAEVCRRGRLTSFNSTRRAAMQAYAMAQVNPEEVDFAEVHDAFTMFEVIGIEDLGFFPAGGGWRAVLEGRTQAHGELPVNPSGGLKARGHPVGASGLAQVVEAYFLLTDQVDPARRLLRPPKVALTQSIGGLGNNNLVTVLVPADRALHALGPWQPTYAPVLHEPAPAGPQVPPRGVAGRVLAATSLHSPPSGFTAPLGLCLVQARGGWRTLAALEPGAPPPPVGTMARLELQEGRYLARPGLGVLRPLVRAWGWLKGIWRRPRGMGGIPGPPRT